MITYLFFYYCLAYCRLTLFKSVCFEYIKRDYPTHSFVETIKNNSYQWLSNNAVKCQVRKVKLILFVSFTSAFESDGRKCLT